MTESEKKEIIKEVFTVLNQYGKTIENLTSITKVAADDLIEVSGGKRIRIGDLLKDVSTIEELKKLFVSKVDSDTANGYIKFPAGISVKGVDISDSLSLWKKKQDPDGNSYLYTDLPIVTRIGLVTYNDDGTINLPNLYDGIPIDGTTIGRDSSGALTVLGGVGSDFDAMQMWNALSGSGAEQINKSHLTDALAGYARTSDIPSLSGYATESWVNDKGYVTTTRLNELIGGASSAFDTLKEIEDYINSHESVTAGLIASLGNKVDKVTGMGLSEHSFTTTLRDKLNSIAEGANKYILPVAKAAVLGGVMIGSNINVNAQGVISVEAPYSHPTQKTITVGAARHFLTGLAVNEYGHVTSATSAALTKDDLLSVLKDKDGVIRLDAQLALTGSLINFANLGTVNIPSLYDGIPVDGKSIYWENGTLKSSSTGGGGLAKVIVKVGLAAYESVDGVVTLPAYPTMPDLTNYVTTNTEQTILGQKTFTSPVFLNHSVIGDALDNISFYTKQFGGQGINMRSLLVSADYSLRNLVPDQGAYFVGDVKASSFVKHGGTANQVLRADGGVETFEYSAQSGQPEWVWGAVSQFDHRVWNPANFRVANANTVGDVGLNRILAYKGTLVSNVNFDNLWEPGCYFNQTGNGENNTNYGRTYSVDLIFGGDAYISQLQHGANNSSLIIRQRWDGIWSSWRSIAFEDGNIESANRLRHARSIWGQPYDGTSNIEGAMFGVRSIGGLTNTSIDYITNHGHHFYTNAGTVHRMAILGNGDVGIGTADPVYKLDVRGDIRSTATITASRVVAGFDSGVAGSVSCSNWFRSSGPTGWFHNEYGGGIYMTDPNYVRVYNSKPFWVDNHIRLNQNSNSSQLLDLRNTGDGWTWMSMGNDRQGDGCVHLAWNTIADTNSGLTFPANSYHIRPGGVNTIAAFNQGGSYFANKVGINTTAPVYHLDVRGTFRVTDELRASTGILLDGLTANTNSHIRLVNGVSHKQWGIKAGNYQVNEDDFTITDDYTGTLPSIRIRSGLERDFLVANRLFVNANKANDRLAANATISLAIGDSDTGFDWASDGVYKIKSDGIDIAQVSQDRFHLYKKMVIESNEGNYCEGIRIKASSSNWVTIALGAVGEFGTSENMWSIHRTADNNFAIARNDSSGVNGMFIGKNGYVGFGTVTPTEKLTVNGWLGSIGSTGWYNTTFSGGMYMADLDQVRVYGNKVLYNDGFRTWGIAGHRVGLKLYNPLHTGINLSNDSYTWGIYSHWNGNMYIGRRSGNVNDESGEYYLIIGAGTMTYNGSIVLNGGGLITYSSDIRLKEIQEYFKPSLNELAALPIFAHSWRNGTPGVQLSTSAQAVQKLMPWNVFEGDDGYLKMDGTRTALAVSIRLAQLANEYITNNERWKSDKDRQIEALQREVRELKQQLNAA